MGYEGHVVGLTERDERALGVETSMALLTAAHSEVGGETISAGGTGTYDLNIWVTEIQAGSYALMDTAYGGLGLPFGQALFVLSTVISSNDDWAVCDAGLKSLGMDHGNPSIEGHTVWFCSDEHVTFDSAGARRTPSPGDPGSCRPDRRLSRGLFMSPTAKT